MYYLSSIDLASSWWIIVQATVNSWKEPFQGDYDVLLVNTLNRMNATRGTTPYANYVPIIQSSGTGKSRTIDEAAHLLFTIPFNVRAPMESGYPAPDIDVRHFLIDQRFGVRAQVEWRFVHFFDALFRCVLETLQTFKEDISIATYEHLASTWRTYLQAGSNRGDLYRRAIKMAEDDFEANSKHGSVDHQVLLQALWPKVHQSAENLIQYIVENWSPEPGNIVLLLYFDETYALSNLRTRDNSATARTHYQILCSALNSFVKSRIFTVFISTYLDLAVYFPHPQGHPSARTSYAPIGQRQTPIVEMPFDMTSEPHLAMEGAHTASDVCETEFMVRFGRMLWWTRYKHGAMSVKGDIIDFAMYKLNGGASIEVPTPDCQLSALIVRILLDLEPRRQIAVDKAVSLVAGNMLIAHCIPEDSEYMWVGAPSEPILAEAAARIMHRVQDIPFFLTDPRNLSFISKGDRGELVARLLLTLAHDSAALLTLAQKPFRFSTPILLTDFLKALLAPSHFEEVMNSRPTNIKAGTQDFIPFKDAFKTSILHFTHFVKAGDGSLLTDEGAWMAFARGMAVQCASNQHCVDLCLMALLSPTHKLHRRNMFPVWVQIKNKATHQRVNIDEKNMKFFSDNDNRPYICITMQLGTALKWTESSQSQPHLNKSQARKRTEPPQPKQSGSQAKKARSQPPSDESPAETTTALSSMGSGIQVVQAFEKGKSTGRVSHPRYAFTISGCSPTVYQVIKPDERGAYVTLLASHSLLQENPRQDSESVEALKRLKPFWSHGLETYGWAASDGPSRTGADVLQSDSGKAVEHADVLVDDDVAEYGVVAETSLEDGSSG
ncbi:hypothetical protein BDP27DRAFT_34021 [Rhodocollybia butyracea]|uniref:Uncharacterized protein n=1 Tax=Rhodocollybia butyracea TaxID=206335 RepID=A0A9P5UDF6_9AGAR|nr:hypothetical protein BDP27DRAFT_34021 [Rhodocollybia butyracea]